MITAPDFSKKQVAFAFLSEGEKISFANDNLIIKNSDGKIRFQCTCYRLFIIYAIGHFSITSALIQKSKKFGFFIALMTPGFRLFSLIGPDKDGNTLLKEKQYSYKGLDIGKHIIKNKIKNQISVLNKVRYKSDYITKSIDSMKSYTAKIDDLADLQTILAYEGLSSKLYFKSHFNNVLWTGRQPRLKKDITNSVLDIGYTILFAFLDAILLSYGFDTYKGVLHTQFYMRKSLVCDIIEPFRPLIDMQVKKSINLKQIKEQDFIEINHQQRLKWEKSSEYVRFIMKPIIENKDLIFKYIQEYYRAFMKSVSADSFPEFVLEG